MNFEQVILAPKSYVGIKRLMTFDEMKDKEIYVQTYGKIMAYLQQKNIQPIGAPVNIYYSWDPVKQETEMAIAFPVSDDTVVEDAELELLKLGELKAIKAVHVGDYMKLSETHDALMKYMKENNFEMDQYAIEEYVTNPQEEPDVSKWITNLYYTVK